MNYVIDNLDMFNAHEAKQVAYIESLPVCCCCKEHIQDDFCFEIVDEVWCEDCMKENFRRSTDYYID